MCQLARMIQPSHEMEGRQRRPGRRSREPAARLPIGLGCVSRSRNRATSGWPTSWPNARTPPRPGMCFATSWRRQRRRSSQRGACQCPSRAHGRHLRSAGSWMAGRYERAFASDTGLQRRLDVTFDVLAHEPSVPASGHIISAA